MIFALICCIYVIADGAETDLNLGNYARFVNVKLSSSNSITTGKIYEEVIKNERSGRYNGRAVQVIPHITDEIKRRIMLVGAKTEADIVIIEIGGTVGDIESIPFLEAARQLIREKGAVQARSLCKSRALCQSEHPCQDFLNQVCPVHLRAYFP